MSQCNKVHGKKTPAGKIRLLITFDVRRIFASGWLFIAFAVAPAMRHSLKVAASAWAH
jgi:hypothetical protein